MPKISQTAKRLRAADIVVGVLKRVPASGPFYVGGKAYTRAELAAFFQAQVDALDAVEAARSVFLAAVARERVISRTVDAAILDLRSAIRVTFGATAETMGDFGLKLPRKPGPKTAAAKAAGAEKLRATRKARRTMGRRQREKIRG